MQNQFDWLSFVPLIGVFAVFYFLILRPQQQKLKAHQNMLAQLKRGDKIVTNGGLIGVVTKSLADDEIQIEIAEGVRVRVAKAMIHSVFTKKSDVAEIEKNSSAA